MLEKLVWTPVVILLTVPWVGLHCCIFFFFFFVVVFVFFSCCCFLCVDGLYVDSHLVCLHNIGIQHLILIFCHRILQQAMNAAAQYAKQRRSVFELTP